MPLAFAMNLIDTSAIRVGNIDLKPMIDIVIRYFLVINHRFQVDISDPDCRSVY